MATILIIEDELAFMEELSDVLRFEGFDILEANNGVAGVHLAQEHLPHLVICDILMPEMDGYDVLTTLRQNLMTATIPFIYMTAKSEHEEIRKGMEMGADDYLIKPATRNEILAAVHSQLEKRALSETQQLRSFSRRLVEIQEHERLRMARLLEDRVGDALAGLGLTFSAAANLPASQLPAMLTEVQKQIQKVMNEVSTISLEFHPSMLEHLGLLPALLWLFGHVSEQTGLQIDFKHAELDRVHMPELKLAAYRIVQEAITNIARHATAREVMVRAWCENDLLNIEVKDDGAGFEVESAVRSGEATGLIGMNDRAASVNGRLTIMSAPRTGATVILQVPLSSQTSEETDRSLKLPSTGDLRNLVGAARVYTSQMDRRPESRRSTSTISIIVAEGSDMVRQGLLWLLSGEADFEVLGEISHGQGVVTAVENLQPDVLILDLMMPGLRGNEIARRVKKTTPEARVLILSNFKGEGYVLEALRSGAMGYALKSSSADELTEAVRQVAAGVRYISPTISEKGIEAYLEALNAQMEMPDLYETLTDREREVLQLVAEGHTNSEIADLLQISPRTAETHRANMLKKLGLSSQAEVIHFAIKRKIVSIGDESP